MARDAAHDASPGVRVRSEAAAAEGVSGARSAVDRSGARSAVNRSAGSRRVGSRPTERGQPGERESHVVAATIARHLTTSNDGIMALHRDLPPDFKRLVEAAFFDRFRCGGVTK